MTGLISFITESRNNARVSHRCLTLVFHFSFFWKDIWIQKGGSKSLDFCRGNSNGSFPYLHPPEDRLGVAAEASEHEEVNERVDGRGWLGKQRDRHSIVAGNFLNFLNLNFIEIDYYKATMAWNKTKVQRQCQTSSSNPLYHLNFLNLWFCQPWGWWLI